MTPQQQELIDRLQDRVSTHTADMSRSGLDVQMYFHYRDSWIEAQKALQVVMLWVEEQQPPLIVPAFGR